MDRKDGKLLSGEFLLPEQSLLSPAGRAHLHYQSDGNLVVYLDGQPVWSSNTSGHTADRLIMQPDGNLVLSDNYGPLASSQTHDHPGSMVQLQDDGNFVIYEDPSGPLAGTPIWASSSNLFVQREPRPPQPVRDSTECRRPLIGPLRIENKLLRDDTGYRRVFFDSWFNALRVLREDPDKFYRWLDDTVRAGYQGSRIFLSVGGWTPYWSNYGVHPVGFREWRYDGNILRPGGYGAQIDAWPDYDDLLRMLLREYRKRKLRLHVTTGDCQIITPKADQEISLHDRLARICAEEGGSEVIALWEVTNEYPMNRSGSDGFASIDQMGDVLNTVRRHLPDVLRTQGACLSEEPIELEKSVTYGELCATHTIRDPFSMCLKRTFGLVYWEGKYRGFKRPFWQGEPKGMNVPPFNDGKGDDMFSPSYDTAEMSALYSMHALTGQGSCYFDGGSVKSTSENQADAWGYDELPTLFEEYLPEDVATWDHGSNGRGGIEYWWKDKDFRTSTMKEWDTTPPKPIATWTLYAGDRQSSGTGTPPKSTGFIVGKFV